LLFFYLGFVFARVMATRYAADGQMTRKQWADCFFKIWTVSFLEKLIEEYDVQLS